MTLNLSYFLRSYTQRKKATNSQKSLRRHCNKMEFGQFTRLAAIKILLPKRVLRPLAS